MAFKKPKRFHCLKRKIPLPAEGTWSLDGRAALASVNCALHLG